MKKNIAIVITRLDLGGAQKVALYLAEHLDRKKFNVHFIAGRGGYMDADFETRYTKPDTQFHLFSELVHPLDLAADMVALFRLYSYFKKNKIDIVHTHSSKAGILGRLAAKMAGVKTIIHTVHGFPFHEYQNPAAHFIYWLIEKIFAGITTKFIAVGKDVMDYGLKKGVGKPGQYVVIRPGVDMGQFKSQKSKVKSNNFLKKYGLKPDVFTVGMIGNCKKQKNPMAFVKIAALVIKEKPKTQFVFAGDGPLRIKAEEFLINKKIDDRVKFIGWTDEPEALMQSLDVFLLTSLWEGIPCTLAQAAAAGKRIVASDIAGNREFMEAISSAGFLYEPHDFKGAAGMICGLEAGKAKGKKVKPAKILKEFDLRYMQKQHEKIYDLMPPGENRDRT